MLISVTCWRCGDYGHAYRECQRPPARKPAELEARVKDITIRWDAGHGFSRTAKKELIAIEKAAYDKQKQKEMVK